MGSGDGGAISSEDRPQLFRNGNAGHVLALFCTAKSDLKAYFVVENSFSRQTESGWAGSLRSEGAILQSVINQTKDSTSQKL
jgi:hypothetical protein